MAAKPLFYTDVHIPKEAVQQLKNKGIDIIHCGEVGMSDADDADHLAYAAEHERVMVSCDEDFEILHSDWQEMGRSHAGIVRFRMQDQCKDIGLIVREISFLQEAADD